MRLAFIALLLVVACGASPAKTNPSLHYSGPQACNFAHLYRVDFSNEYGGGSSATRCGAHDSALVEIAYPAGGTSYQWIEDGVTYEGEYNPAYPCFLLVGPATALSDGGTGDVVTRITRGTLTAPTADSRTFRGTGGTTRRIEHDGGPPEILCNSDYDIVGTPLD